MNHHYFPNHPSVFFNHDSLVRIRMAQIAESGLAPTRDSDEPETSVGPTAILPRKTLIHDQPRRPVYTKTGDFGRCSLLSGQRVLKDADQVEASGNIDELNSILGVLVSMLPQDALWLSQGIQGIQMTLFKVGALVATERHSIPTRYVPPISDEDIKWLEWSINAMDDRLPALECFLIPGGHPSAAYAHLARSVCRRAERQVVRSFKDFGSRDLPEPLTNALAYLNRLSDFLFVLGRWFNARHQVPEKILERNLKAGGDSRPNCS